VKVALLPGDGIGPEVVAEAAKVLERLRREGLPIETETAPIGGAAYDAAGSPLPESTLRLAQGADALLMGAVGGPQYDALPRAMRPERGSSLSARRWGCSPTFGRRCSSRNSRRRRRSSRRSSPASI